MSENSSVFDRASIWVILHYKRRFVRLHLISPLMTVERVRRLLLIDLLLPICIRVFVVIVYTLPYTCFFLISIFNKHFYSHICNKWIFIIYTSKTLALYCLHYYYMPIYYSTLHFSSSSSYKCIYCCLYTVNRYICKI